MSPCKNTLLGYAQAARPARQIAEIVRQRAPARTDRESAQPFPCSIRIEGLVGVIFIDQENVLLCNVFSRKLELLTSYDICFFFPFRIFT